MVKVYDWSEIAAFYDAGHTLKETIAKYGFSKKSWNDAKKRGDVKPRLSNGLAELLPVESMKNRTGIKNRLIKTGVLTYACAICGNTGEWLGQPLSLQIDHIDGNKHNNSVDNLRLLCPNCHHQQPTSNGKNKGKTSHLTT